MSTLKRIISFNSKLPKSKISKNKFIFYWIQTIRYTRLTVIYTCIYTIQTSDERTYIVSQYNFYNTDLIFIDLFKILYFTPSLNTSLNWFQLTINSCLASSTPEAISRSIELLEMVDIGHIVNIDKFTRYTILDWRVSKCWIRFNSLSNNEPVLSPRLLFCCLLHPTLLYFIYIYFF